MDDNISGEESIDWDSEDEHEIDQHFGSSGESDQRLGEASSSSISGNSKLIHHFVGMGFSKKMVLQVIEENGTEDTESLLETLLTYSVLDDTSDKEGANPDCSVNGCEGSFLESLSDSHDSSGDEESQKPCTDDDDKLLLLASMGYTGEEAFIAIERCGQSSSIAELTDFICAAQMAKDEDTILDEHKNHQKRKSLDYELSKQRKQRQRLPNEYDTIVLPNPMIGFGLPEDFSRIHRSLPEAATGPPYFYYENVALAPKGVWDTISQYLYDVEPEFVDSKYFCATARKRGYVHNLPIEGRYPLLPMPPSTIHEAFPLTRKWWPSWDSRTKLNCLQTVIGSARNADRIRKALEAWAELPEPPVNVQKYVLEECRKWNLVWVGRNKVAPLEPDEVEMLLGFPRNHTRGGGISRTDRYKSLGNSFQVDTVAFHLSVLKGLFPNGLNVLSLFSGIGGAEVALHRLGIPLNAVVSVEISETNRNIVRSWWEQTNQKGELIHVPDVQQLTSERVEKFIDTLGGFDLVIGGSPCNNLAGSNRVSRDGLEGKESSLFYDYHRILDRVKSLMEKDHR